MVAKYGPRIIPMEEVRPFHSLFHLANNILALTIQEEITMKNKRILLVDDESDVTIVLTFALEDYGFEVESYNNPLVALSNFKPNYYDLAILDIKMPEMNGFELLREIRKEDENLRICFLTALTELRDHMSDINELSPAFVKDGIIRKPISNKDLLNDINRILSSS
jgi:two-component system, OmpR family, response regulator ChvI